MSVGDRSRQNKTRKGGNNMQDISIHYIVLALEEALESDDIHTDIQELVEELKKLEQE